jgi:acetylornithine deacetylase/succinyl-diaminopimelate desuccinylase-like protein
MKSRFLILLLLGLHTTSSAGPIEVATQVRDWRMQHEQHIVDQFSTLLSIPNVASDTVNVRRNAVHIRQLFESRGLQAELLELDGANPLVFATREAPGATTTVMIYIHYDGQPVNPSDWASDPWTPVMRTDMVENDGKLVPMKAPFDPNWRIFARSAGDDKAPVIALSAALDALKENGIEPTVNLKIILDGEEEAGSPNLLALLEKYRHKLDSDLWLFCDGPVHQSRRWQLSYGVRGAYGFNLTVYGPNRPLHSGHYGNWAPNPIVRLTHLVDSMRDLEGNILVDGFLDEVRAPTTSELAAIAAAPAVGPKLKTELGLAQAETDERPELAIMRPALNLRGIRSGDTGAAARNSIQPSAEASIGIRLVPDQTPAHLRQVIDQHIRNQGYFIVTHEPTAEERATHPKIARLDWRESGYPAYRASMELPVAQRISKILMRLSDGTLVQSPTMGGSLPLHPVSQLMDTPIVILPIANHDNNQHGKNENLRLQNLWDAIEIYAAVLTGL